MSQSAKRYGLEVEGDLELESRLRRMEVAIASLSPNSTGDFTQTTTTSRGGGTVPQVTGLALRGSAPGTFTVGWNDVTISDLRRYDIQFATDAALTENLEAFTAATPIYAFTTADTSVSRIYFSRVRAVNSAGVVGPWSGVLNTTTGQVTTPDIEDTAVTDPKLETDAVASGRVLGHLSGGILSNGTDAANDIDISKFAARDFADSLTMTGDGITKQIDAVWGSGTNAGGLPSALVPVEVLKWYHVFVISNADGTTIDAGFDTSTIAANLLADSGLTLYRRVGSTLTDASGEILAFRQYGDRVIWDTPVSVFDSTNPGSTRVSVTTKSPNDIITLAAISLFISNTNGNTTTVMLSSLDATDVAPTNQFGHGRSNINGNQTSTGDVVTDVPTNITSQIGFRVGGESTGGSATRVSINSLGYVDRRGQDGGL